MSVLEGTGDSITLPERTGKVGCYRVDPEADGFEDDEEYSESVEEVVEEEDAGDLFEEAEEVVEEVVEVEEEPLEVPDISEGYWLLTTSEWENSYIYVQNTEDGNVRAWQDEDPGPQGHFKFTQNEDGTWLISTKAYPNWFVYMQDSEDGNVRCWEEDPGEQGWWNVEHFRCPEGRVTQAMKLTTAKWPEWFLYEQNQEDGNVRGWSGDPGPQGWLVLTPAPETEEE